MLEPSQKEVPSALHYDLSRLPHGFVVQLPPAVSTHQASSHSPAVTIARRQGLLSGLLRANPCSITASLTYRCPHGHQPLRARASSIAAAVMLCGAKRNCAATTGPNAHCCIPVLSSVCLSSTQRRHASVPKVHRLLPDCPATCWRSGSKQRRDQTAVSLAGRKRQVEVGRRSAAGGGVPILRSTSAADGLASFICAW
jgi:hypothetical protein